MKNYIIILLSFSFFSCKKETVPFDQETSDVITTFYGDALEFKESYELLRSLSKDVGQRLSGSEGAKKAVLWSKEVMENYGFDTVYLQEVMVPHWERGKVEEAYFYSEKEKINLSILGAGGTVSTPKEGITAGVVEVASLDEVDELGREKIEGKIVFYNKAFNQRYINQGASYGQTGFQRRSGAVKAAEHGALASVFRSLSSSTYEDFPHTGGMSYKEGLDSIPHGGLGVLSSEKLSKALKENPNLKLTVKLSGKWFPDALSHNVVGELKGMKNPEKIITVGGHLDSWDVGEGAHDDGAGCVHSIGALRLFQKQKIKPNNTIRAVMFMNEENGLRGGQKYADVAVMDNEQHIAAIESDASGYVPRGFGFSGSDEQHKKIQDWLKYFDKNTISYFSKGGGGADIGPLHRKTGTPMFGLSIDGQKYFEMHHTAKDVFELVNARELELGTASMASLVYLIDKYGL
ncbi:MAG: peptidase M28 family protein [Euryarchaeota archaeon]|nr:peptidase M28 family protein [Euryarchaeota archaeon]|tara:strand:+ start:199 stop:1584 length:1386 start_codon:yes stop_codon:yes gene_type:complete